MEIYGHEHAMSVKANEIYRINSTYFFYLRILSIESREAEPPLKCLIKANVTYSRLPITRTFKGNRKKFELSGVRVIGSSKKISGSKVKNSFYCTVNILIKFYCTNVK